MRLTNRERWLIVCFGVIVGAWLLFVFAIKPATERIKTLNRVIPQKQRILRELQAKGAEYLALQAGLDNSKRRIASEDKEFELLAFLESATKKYGLASKVVTMKQEKLQLDSNYCQTIVETKLENVTLKQLVEFLSKIKSSNHFLQIETLYVKKNATNPNLLDTVIQMSALKPNKVSISSL